MRPIQIIEIDQPSKSKAFIELPWSIYAGNPNWVPPLRLQVQDMLNTEKHPFYQTHDLKGWMAYDNGKAVGRIVGIFPKSGSKIAKFGFYEATHNADAADALFDVVFAEAKRRGFEKIEGPHNPSANYECAFLVEGFDKDPTVMMPYNPPYYLEQLDRAGFKKAKDLLAFEIGSDFSFDPKLYERVKKISSNPDIKIRSIDMSKFKEEGEQMLSIYNDAWEDNWGFEKLTDQEIRGMIKEMKPILDPDYVLIAEVKGYPAAFAFSLPDLNQAIKKTKNGKLTPGNILSLLWNIKGPGRKKTIKKLRILTLGVRKQFREYPLAALMYIEMLKRAPLKGYTAGEASWILEDNGPMLAGLKNMGAQQTKRYRLYERSL